MTVRLISPEGLHPNPTFSQLAVIGAGTTFVLVGGQNGVDAEGRIAKDLGAQTERALANLDLALNAGGTSKADLVQVSIHLAGEDLGQAFAKWQAFWDVDREPPLVKVLRVAGLANPAFRIEIEAIAALAAA